MTDAYPGLEGAAADVAPDHGHGQGPHRHDGQAPPLGPGPEVEHDVSDAPGHAEQAEAGQGEVEQGQGPTLVGGATGEGGHGVHQCGEVGRNGPGRPGVASLVEERGHPGDEGHAADDHRGQNGPRRVPAGLRGPPGLPAQPQRRHRHQVQRPVLAVEQRRGRDGHADQVADGRPVEGPLHGHQPGGGEEGHQRVHPVLGGVAHGEGGRSHQDHGTDGHRPAADAAARHPDEGQSGTAEHAGQGAHGQVGGSEPPDPEVQQDVVQRRRAVPFQRAVDLPQGQPGDVEGERLVQPQVRARPEAQGDTDGDGHHGPDDEQPWKPAGRNPRPVRIPGQRARRRRRTVADRRTRRTGGSGCRGRFRRGDGGSRLQGAARRRSHTDGKRFRIHGRMVTKPRHPLRSAAPAPCGAERVRRAPSSRTPGRPPPPCGAARPPTCSGP